jgi:hypothetical protein
MLFDGKHKKLTENMAEDIREIKECDLEEKESISRMNKVALSLAERFEKLEILEFLELKSNPWKMLALNFLGGLARGFGIAVGLTVVFGLAAYVLSRLISLPIIGEYIAQIVEIVNQYSQQGIH